MTGALTFMVGPEANQGFCEEEGVTLVSLKPTLIVTSNDALCKVVHLEEWYNASLNECK